jgi:hypothetical protein
MGRRAVSGHPDVIDSEPVAMPTPNPVFLTTKAWVRTLLGTLSGDEARALLAERGRKVAKALHIHPVLLADGTRLYGRPCRTFGELVDDAVALGAAS